MTTFCTGVLCTTAILIAFTGGEIRAAEGDQESQGVKAEIPAQQSPTGTPEAILLRKNEDGSLSVLDSSSPPAELLQAINDVKNNESSSTIGVLPNGRIVTFEKDPQTGALVSAEGIRVTQGGDGELQAIKEPTVREGCIIVVRDGVEYLQYKDAEGNVVENALSQHLRRVIIGELDVTQALADGHCSLPMLRGILVKAKKPLAKNFDNAAFAEWDGSLPAGFDIEVAKRLDQIKESGLKIQAAQGADGNLLLHWLTSTRNDQGQLVIGNNIYLIDPNGGVELIEAPIANG